MAASINFYRSPSHDTPGIGLVLTNPQNHYTDDFTAPDTGICHVVADGAPVIITINNCSTPIASGCDWTFGVLKGQDVGVTA